MTLNFTPYPAFCSRCQNYPVAYNATGLCSRCGICSYCGATPATNAEDRRCANCRCWVCGDAKSLMTDHNRNTLPNGNYALICPKDFAEKYPKQSCQKCKKSIATVIWRGGGSKPTLCERCSFPSRFTPGAPPLSCAYCNNPGTYVRAVGNHQAVTCTEHGRNRVCWKNGCRPNKQCGMCIARMEAENEHRHNLNDTILFVQRAPTFLYAEKISMRMRNRNPRLIAAEIEVAGLKSYKGATKHYADEESLCKECFENKRSAIRAVADKWGMSIVRDGSLPQGGFEINTNPAGGDIWLNQIDEIHTPLRDAGAYVTAACGLHVHIDARDYDYAALRRLVLLYAQLEPAVLRTQPASRILNVQNEHRGYARPCAKVYMDSLDNLKPPVDPRLWYKATKRGLTKTIYGEEYPEKAPHPLYAQYNDARYNGLNLNSWFFRGSIEIRYHSGTTKKSNIQTWGIIWANVVSEALRMTENDIKALGQTTKTPQEKFIDIATKGCTNKGAAAIERYLRLRWREFESGYERSEF